MPGPSTRRRRGYGAECEVATRWVHRICLGKARGCCGVESFRRDLLWASRFRFLGMAGRGLQSEPFLPIEAALVGLIRQRIQEPSEPLQHQHAAKKRGSCLDLVRAFRDLTDQDHTQTYKRLVWRPCCTGRVTQIRDQREPSIWIHEAGMRVCLRGVGN